MAKKNQKFSAPYVYIAIFAGLLILSFLIFNFFINCIPEGSGGNFLNNKNCCFGSRKVWLEPKVTKSDGFVCTK